MTCVDSPYVDAIKKGLDRIVTNSSKAESNGENDGLVHPESIGKSKKSANKKGKSKARPESPPDVLSEQAQDL